MLKFVLASHGKMAEGIRDSIHLILGEAVKLHTICAYSQGPDDVTKEIEKLFHNFNTEDDIIVMTDLFGGSVNSAFVSLLSKRRFWLVTGISLGLVTEILLIREEDNIGEKIEIAVENARKLMCLCNPIL